MSSSPGPQGYNETLNQRMSIPDLSAKSHIHGSSNLCSMMGLSPWINQYRPYYEHKKDRSLFSTDIEPLLVEANFHIIPSRAALTAHSNERLRDQCAVDFDNAILQPSTRAQPKLAMNAAHLNLTKDLLYYELPPVHPIDQSEFMSVVSNLRPGELYGVTLEAVGVMDVSPPLPSTPFNLQSTSSTLKSNLISLSLVSGRKRSPRDGPLGQHPPKRTRFD